MSEYSKGFAQETTNFPELAGTPLCEDLFRLYKERKLCDITLRVQQKTFPAHKTILCARSPVFQTMFETDAEEKRTGIVNIADLDPDTVEKMLDFLYTDVLDLQPDSVIRLYYAADKYQIGFLKHQCSSFLKSKLNVSNVLQVLTLADLHKDADLKKSAYTFIATNATAIFKSEAWKNFMIQNASIASEVMQFLFVKKGVTCSSSNAGLTPLPDEFHFFS